MQSFDPRVIDVQAPYHNLQKAAYPIEKNLGIREFGQSNLVGYGIDPRDIRKQAFLPHGAQPYEPIEPYNRYAWAGQKEARIPKGIRDPRDIRERELREPVIHREVREELIPREVMERDIREARERELIERELRERLLPRGDRDIRDAREREFMDRDLREHIIPRGDRDFRGERERELREREAREQQLPREYRERDPREIRERELIKDREFREAKEREFRERELRDPKVQRELLEYPRHFGECYQNNKECRVEYGRGWKAPIEAEECCKGLYEKYPYNPYGGYIQQPQSYYPLEQYQYANPQDVYAKHNVYNREQYQPNARDTRDRRFSNLY